MYPAFHTGTVAELDQPDDGEQKSDHHIAEVGTAGIRVLDDKSNKGQYNENVTNQQEYAKLTVPFADFTDCHKDVDDK